MSTKTRASWLSGFCSAGPVERYPDSHAQCDKHPRYEKPCACQCHWVPETPAGTGAGEQDPQGTRVVDAQTTAQPDAIGSDARPSLVITTPCLLYDLADDVYHDDPVPGGSLSSTFARLLTEHVPSKALARRQNRKPTKAMNLGKAAHAHALGAGPELVVWEHDGRTKEGKAERAAASLLLETEAAVAVTPSERDQILGMAEVMRAEPTVRRILDESQAEVSAFWREGPIWGRARYDLLSKKAAYDYKTTTDASRRGFAKHMASYGYHQQADWYQRGLKALDHPAAAARLRFICQETEPPYLVQIHEPDDDAMEIAGELNDRAVRIYAEALATGHWPGPERLINEPASLPPFYFYDHGEVLDLPDEMVI